MNGLNIIAMLVCLGMGCLIGLIIEMMLDANIIRELQDDNRRLRLLNAQITKEQNVQYIEINDTTVEPENVPSYSKDW